MRSLFKNVQIQERTDALLRTIFRWKWLITCCVLVIMLLTSFYCIVANEMFRSSTTILVIPQKIPDDYVKSTVTLGSERLNTLKQEIFSRTRLLNVINEFNLFSEWRGGKTDDDLIESMRARIKVELLGGKRAFRIEYSARDPQTAMDVTSRLASLFIDENIKMREQQASSTAQFLDARLAETKRSLDEKDKKVILFKTRYLGELPEQLNANLSMLSRYKDEMKTNVESIRSVEERILFINTQIASVKASSPATLDMDLIRVDSSFSDTDAKIISLEERLVKKKADLSEMAVRYTVNHPEYKKVKNDCIRLENALNELKGKTPINEETNIENRIREVSEIEKHYGEIKGDWNNKIEGIFDKTAKGKISQTEAMRDYKRLMDKSLVEMEEIRSKINSNPRELNSNYLEDATYVSLSNKKIIQSLSELVQMKRQLESQLKRLKQEKEEIKKEISFYSERLESTSKRELELKELTRDYNNLLRTYEDLLGKKTNADMSHALEIMQKGEQFQIMDPAYLPEVPYKPRRLIILMGAFCFSIFLGIGGAALIENFDRSIKTASEFKEFTDVPLLASLPEVLTETVKTNSMKRRILILAGLFLYFAATLLLYYVYMDRIKFIVTRFLARLTILN